MRTLMSYADNALEGNLDEVLSVLQQQETNKTGKTEELLNAVLNVLENLKLELIESHSGVPEVLRDVAALLVETRTSTALEKESAKLDELLERLDFVASGGMDEEVPRVRETEVVTKPAANLPKLPIKRPPNFEDPMLVHHVERLTSLNAILGAHALGTSESDRKNQLQIEQLNLATFCLRAAKRETTLELYGFADELSQKISDTLKDQTNNLVGLVHHDATEGVMYRSLADVLQSRLHELVTIFGSELTSHSDSKIHIEICVRKSYLVCAIEFVGLRTAFDLITQRMDELSLTNEDVPIREKLATNQEIQSNTLKTRKERIAHGLVDFRGFVDSAHGRIEVASDDDEQLKVTFEIPLLARVLHTLPIVIGSDAFLLESHLITYIVDCNEAKWDESRTHVEFEDSKYQLCLVADNIQATTKPSDDTTKWLLLLDTTDRSIALEVETIREPELHFSTPSKSEIRHGHTFLGRNKLKLLLDPMELRPSGSNPIPALSDKTVANHFLCFKVSQPLVDKFRRCFDTEQVLVRRSRTLSDTLSQLQEFCPDYLIIEDRADEFRAIDAVQRISHALPSLRFSVLLFVETDFQPVAQLKHMRFKLVYLPKNVDFGQLKSILVENQDFAKSVVE